MGLFDRLAKSITTPAEKAISALRTVPGVREIKNYLEVEDLSAKVYYVIFLFYFVKFYK